MKGFKKKSLKVSILLAVIMSLIISKPMAINAAETEVPNEVFNEVSLEELEIGVPVTTYHNLDTGVKIEIELIKEEAPEVPEITPLGDTGWSGGELPPYEHLTLAVRANKNSIITLLEYRVNVNGITNSITSAHSLVYIFQLYTMQTTSLNVTNTTPSIYDHARAEMTYTAVLIEYGIVVNSIGGYLTFEINTSGQVRTTWM